MSGLDFSSPLSRHQLCLRSPVKVILHFQYTQELLNAVLVRAWNENSAWLHWGTHHKNFLPMWNQQMMKSVRHSGKIPKDLLSSKLSSEVKFQICIRSKNIKICTPHTYTHPSLYIYTYKCTYIHNISNLDNFQTKIGLIQHSLCPSL